MGKRLTQPPSHLGRLTTTPRCSSLPICGRRLSWKVIGIEARRVGRIVDRPSHALPLSLDSVCPTSVRSNPACQDQTFLHFLDCKAYRRHSTTLRRNWEKIAQCEWSIPGSVHVDSVLWTWLDAIICPHRNYPLSAVQVRRGNSNHAGCACCNVLTLVAIRETLTQFCGFSMNIMLWFLATESAWRGGGDVRCGGCVVIRHTHQYNKPSMSVHLPRENLIHENG